MTKHKVTPEQWASIKKSSRDCIYDAALLELRDRWMRQHAKSVESNYPELPDSSLVERVRQAQGCGNERDARAAIREVAAWLRQRDTRVKASVEIASDLEREAERGT